MSDEASTDGETDTDVPAAAKVKGHEREGRSAKSRVLQAVGVLLFAWGVMSVFPPFWPGGIFLLAAGAFLGIYGQNVDSTDRY